MAQHNDPSTGIRIAPQLACAIVLAFLAWPAQRVMAQECPAPGDVQIDFVSSQSYCELCGVGEITVRVEYDGSAGPGQGDDDPPITDIVIRENLSSPALVPIPGTTTIDVGSGIAPPPPTPTFNGGEWVWDFGDYELQPAGPSGGQFLEITFDVRRENAASEEGLWNEGSSTPVASSVSYGVGGPACDTDTTSDQLEVRRPEPTILKDGRNVDADQQGWSGTVYGHNNDDIIWRIRIQNAGDADLQDLRLDDIMGSGNLDINYACPTDGDAATIASNDGGGPIPAGCMPAGNTFTDFEVVNPFGSGSVTNYGSSGDDVNGFTRDLNGRDIDVDANVTDAVLFLVGKVTADASCFSGGTTNTAGNLEFGCEADGSEPGGINAVTSDTEELRTYHGDEDAQLTITRSFTGVNTVGSTTVSNRPVGARGLVTLTIENDTGGTVTEIVLDDVLPEEYVMDPTYWSGGSTQVLPVRGTPVAGESSIDPAYGAYPGMIDRVTWENPPAGSLTPPSQVPLDVTAPQFRLWSTTPHPDYPEQEHMLRHGDVVTVTFPIVLISQDRNAVEPYDLVADLDVTPEETTSDGTDPAFTALLSNQLTVNYDTFCPTQGPSNNGHFTLDLPNNSIDAFPEDIDVEITDITNNPGPVFILTNDPDQELPLRVRLTNSGGHDATGYHAFVSFGATMEVVDAPGSCSVVSPLGGDPPQPDPWKTWVLPDPIPSTATVYDCTPPSIAPNQTRNLDFEVIKSGDPGRVALDDLTFRADVVGEILLHDGTPLWFPTPVTRPDGELDRANNYSLDGVRQRVIGFNLIKTTLGCNENDPPAFEPGPNIKDAARVEIGEECTYHVESGGWFGFETPGFVLIAVEDVELTDDLPAGQGYLSSTDPNPTSTPQIAGITLMGSAVPPTPNGLDDLFTPGQPFDWRFNQTQRIDRLDEWFRADVTTRVLNNPIDVRGLPNVHAELSTNVLVSEFTAIFEPEGGGAQITPRLGPSTVGYPNEPIRREDLTITEPFLELVKEVCNETRYGTGPACSNWTTLADDGDAFNSYIYRITVTNRAADDGIARSPAYDVVVTDTLDSSGFACVMPFESDGLDNDADSNTDEGEEDEGTLTGTAMGDCPSGRNGVVTFRHEHSTGLLRIDPGQSVELYYRVDYDDDAAPQQTFTNSVTASYDSLAGSANESGNQTVDPRPNSDIGGARVYTSDPVEAGVQIIPVETPPKIILQTSNTPLTPAPGPQEVVIGEEIEYELTTLLPVALLREFVIRDELPPGIACAEAPAVDLDAAPYSTAGFQPGGTITPTCSDDAVEWTFGNQRITQGTTPDNRYPFSIQFIARVENGTLTNEDEVLSNGDPATSVTARYIDEADNEIELTYGQVDVVVREPAIELTKTFAPEEADAADVLTVTVTATNTGTATAYNLRVLDILTGTEFSYAGNVGGTTPPVDVTEVAEGPIFSWDPGFAIAAGDSIDFTFDVEVGDSVRPLQVLENTIQGDWTSLPGQDTALNSGGSIGANGAVDGMRNGALPNAGDAVNDYETEASDSVEVPPLAIDKIDVDPSLTPEIGAHKPFEVRIDLPEGVTDAVSLSDALDSGSASYVLADNADFDVTYEFVDIAAINGQPPAAAAFSAVPADGTGGTAIWDIGTVTTATEDDTAAAAVTPYILIGYHARINNDLDTNVGSTLQNAATLEYTNGESGGTEVLNDTTPAIAAIEPNLTATKAIANVTPGKAADDPIELNDIVQYTLTIPNIGTANAYDVNVTDALPPELRLYGGYTPTAQVNGIDVAAFVPAPSGAPDGPLVWGAGNDDLSLDVGPGETLEITYQVQLVAPADQDIAIRNIVWVDWTSRQDDDVYERTGEGCPTITAPDDYCYGPASADGTPFPVGPPDPPAKANTQPTATIGEAFRYRITIPATPYELPMHDVRILDDLDASAADLSYVGVSKVSGSGAWTPVNSGDAKNLVIGDAATGIDIPIGEQVVLDVSVRLDDTPTNVAGLTFTNLASYTYNRLDNAPATELTGGSGLTQPMTVVEPYDLTVEKSGPAQMQLGLAGTFSLNVHNVGDSPAHGVTLYDVLPNAADGGMCDNAPSGFAAQVFEADGTTVVSPQLVEGTDFSVTFAGDPDCTLTVTALTPAAAVGPDERLIVSYQAYLDLDSEQGATLTNVAGATEWSGLDVADDTNDPYARTYTRTLTDGTVDTLDHEDAHSIVVFVPVLIFEKTVANLTSGDDPAAVATPGDTLRYSLRVENASDTPLDGFRIVDELDALNSLPAFEPGSLTLVTVPDGADATGTDANGGAAGTGLVDVDDLSLGGLGETVLLEFDVTLAPALPDESFVYNQSEIRFADVPVAQSDDPNVNGAADPEVAGDEDPTQVQIESAPAFRVEKVSSYITGDPDVLLAGETLRYTITVQNVGTDHATGVSIADQVPGNTRYVPGSTILNGAQVPDAADGGSPLTDGIEINAPGEATPGVMNAAAADNVATIGFDVTVYPDVPDGTVISNQAFVSAVDFGLADVPSDDPRTPVADDPTRDVVGNFPLLFAPKTAALVEDLGSPGIVDPGDVLRYTITVYNDGAVPATYVELSDEVPNDTTYIADSTTLNGLPAGVPDGGVFPLEGGVAVSGANLTPPLPGEGEGVIDPGEAAVVQFDVRVDDMTPTGTLITNQAIVATEELPNVLTDGDGNPATGPEPTVVVVGDVQALSIVKEVAVAGGGPAVAGAMLEYTVTATNIAALPAQYVRITDDLDEVTPGYLTYVDQSAMMNGLAGGVTFLGTTITADYFGEYGALPPGETVRLRFRATIDPNLEDGTTITNLARVAWNDPVQYAEARVSIDVGGVPNAGILSGNVFHDADHDDSPDAVERPLEAWTVELLRDDEPVRTLQTDADGNYRINGVPPNYLNGQSYALRFSAPGASSRTALMGVTDSDFTDGLQRIEAIVVQGGSNLRQLNMPVDPNGVVYDSVARSPIAGAMVTMRYASNGQAVPSSCFDDPNQQGQVTIGNGYYKFDLNFADAACPAGDSYRIEVVAPDSSYVGGESELIPPSSDPFGQPFDVPACPGSTDDAVVATSDYCEAQPSEFAPQASVRARSEGTRYHTFLELDDSAVPGSAQLFNNHIPLDPRLGGAVSVTKTTPMLNVTRGQMVPYVITVSNSFGVDLQDVNVVDRFPAGFKYVEGSARFDEERVEPALVGRELIWSDLSLATDSRHTIKLLLAVGAGVSEGEFVNRALAVNALTGGTMSEEATATVRIVPDPTFDCTDVTGKVFDDLNLNGYQDGDETGVAGARVVTARGLAATTDQHGRYHFTCALVPNEFRGSNFVLKLDDRTLPSGFRPTTRLVQLKRATRGKALEINFGATIHRVVGLDLSDPVFVPGEVEVREQWRHRIGLLVEELRKGPAVLRLAYVADVEEKALVNARLNAISSRIRAEWRQVDAYELVIEPEIFWRLGGPPETPKVRKK